jgi:hypothetical protein
MEEDQAPLRKAVKATCMKKEFMLLKFLVGSESVTGAPASSGILEQYPPPD